MDDIYIRYVKFPSVIKAITRPCKNGGYDVYINISLDEYQREDALNHELEHIKNNDFYSCENVKAIEERTCGKVKAQSYS